MGGTLARKLYHGGVEERGESWDVIRFGAWIPAVFDCTGGLVVDSRAADVLNATAAWTPVPVRLILRHPTVDWRSWPEWRDPRSGNDAQTHARLARRLRPYGVVAHDWDSVLDRSGDRPEGLRIVDDSGLVFVKPKCEIWVKDRRYIAESDGYGVAEKLGEPFFDSSTRDALAAAGLLDWAWHSGHHLRLGDRIPD